MSLGRRKVSLDDEAAWIFNRMVKAYESRPAYPEELVDAVAGLCNVRAGKICDIGAGIGHLSLPLAARGFEVSAVEPAREMLSLLEDKSRAAGLSIQPIHATAEALSHPDSSQDLVVISDALHFLDATRTANEVARVLAPHGALALVTCQFTKTPFMRSVEKLMAEAAPRRPRKVSSAVKQVLSVSKVREQEELVFTDETLVDAKTLEGILCSISFIGPAMNTQRYEAFRARIHAIEYEPRWSRTFTLHGGMRLA